MDSFHGRYWRFDLSSGCGETVPLPADVLRRTRRPRRLADLAIDTIEDAIDTIEDAIGTIEDAIDTGVT